MHLPNVIKDIRIPAGIELELFVSTDLEAFDGHFDSMPIIPGVVQIQWAIDFAKIYMGENEGFEVSCLEKLKFQHVIQPDSYINLKLEVTDNKLSFALSSDKKKYSSGRIVMTQ